MCSAPDATVCRCGSSFQFGFVVLMGSPQHAMFFNQTMHKLFWPRSLVSLFMLLQYAHADSHKLIMVLFQFKCDIVLSRYPTMISYDGYWRQTRW